MAREGNGTGRLRRLSSLPRWARIGLAVAGAAVLAAGGAQLARAIGGPTASFSYSPTAPIIGGTVSFSNQSSAARTVDSVQYTWDFGDGGTATSTNPGHVYTQPGVYDVTLAATENDPSGALVGSDTTTGAVTVASSPTAPVDDTYQTSQSTTLTIAAPGVLGNDPAGTATAVAQTGVTTSAGGTLTLDTTGAFTYVPLAGYAGPDVFTYSTKDGNGDDLGTATVRIDVVGPNPDAYTAQQNTQLVVDASNGVLADDWMVAAAAPQTGQTAQGGTVDLAADGSFTYDPPADFVGVDSFTYTATNGNGADIGSATVTIGVTGVRANDDGPYPVSSTSATAIHSSVLDNDNGGAEGHAFLVQDASSGTVDLAADGTFSYTPNTPNFTGTDSFTYDTTYGDVQSNTATVRLSVQPGPPNDALADAVAIQAPSGTDAGDNTNATLEPGEKVELDTAGVETGKTIWWAWTAPSSGTYEFDTAGSAIEDSTLAVYTGSQDDAASLTEVTSDDDSFEFGLQAKVMFDASAGTTYFIAVGAYEDEAGGGITMNWGPVAPPANDLVANAQALEGDSGSVDGTTVGATTDEGDPFICDCNNFAGTVWYQLRTSSSGPATVDVTGADAAGVFSGLPGNLVKLAPPPEGTPEQPIELSFDATSDTTYWIEVASFPGNAGDFSLTWQVPPSNDDFANARVLDGDQGSIDGTTVGATLEEGETTHDEGVANTVWYAWTPSASGPATLTYASEAAGSLAVYDRNSDAQLESLGNDEDSGELSVSFDAVAGVTYDVQVGSYGGSPAPFTLGWGLDSSRVIQGTVFDSGNNVADGVLVRVCLGGSCSSVTSDANGGFAIDGLEPGDYSLEATPSPAVGLATRMSVDTSGGSVRELSVRLAAVATSGGAEGPTAFTVSDCANGTLAYELDAGGTRVGSGSTTGDADGHYRIGVSDLGHFAALTLTSTIACPDSPGRTETSVLYTDPSGTVVDDGAGGVPLAGASVTLLHDDLTPVQPGDSSLSPATPANPETSDAHGAWGWNVAPGTYVVFAEKQGCGSTTSSPVTVTRGNPQTGVVLHLNCPTPTAPPPATQQPPPPPPPTPGVNLNVTPVIGTVLVNGQPLQFVQQIPLGAVIDATNGIVGLTTIGTTGLEQTMYFFNAVFLVTQAADGVTEITLQGGDFDICVAPKAARRTVASVEKKPKPKPHHKPKPKPRVAASTKVVRALWGEGKGSFRTQGRYSAATVRGTMWLTEDRCDGTYTKVLEGAVDVLDQVNNKHLTVIAGHSVIVHPKS